MKPWQAKWYEFKRFNPNKGLIATLAIFAICAVVFFMMPSARDERIARKEKTLLDFIKRKDGRLATVAEKAEILSTHNFTVRKIDRAPEIYLFVPALNNNVAVLGRLDHIRPGLDGYSVTFIPLPQKESPTTERAVGMCLLPNPDWRVTKLIKAAPIIRSSIAAIDKKWTSLSESEKEKIEQMTTENGAIQSKLGKYSAFVLDGDRGILMQNWFDVSELGDYIQYLRIAKRRMGDL